MPYRSLRLRALAALLCASALAAAPATFAAEPVPVATTAADAELERVTKQLAELRKVDAKPIPPAVRAETVDALRALAKLGTPKALRALVQAAGDRGGAFRPEIAKLLQELGDRAVPALLATKKGSPAGVRAFAFAQLEAMGKRIAGDAVQTQDAGILAEVLTVFGETGDLDALPVVLAFVNADRAPVREAARKAVLAYGQEAQWKVRETYSVVTGTPASDAWSYAETATHLFAAYDRLRQKELYELHEKGLAAATAGNVEEAAAAFDAVLARAPLFEERAQMSGTYVALGEKLEETDGGAARVAYQKALRIAPDSARAPRARAGLAYIEARALATRGIEDDAAFEHVLELDPGHAAARTFLVRRGEARLEREQRLRAFAGGAGVLLLGVLAAILFGRFGRAARPSGV